MRIPIFFGFKLAGILERKDGSAVATRVFHLWQLPVVPLGFLQRSARGWQPTSFQPLSLLAAYFKAWGFVASILFAWFAYISILSPRDASENALPFVVGPLLLFASVLASWLWLGRGPTRVKPAGYVISAVLLGLMAAPLISAYSRRASAFSSDESGDVASGPAPAQYSAPEGWRVHDGLAIGRGDEIEVRVTGGFYKGVFVGRAGDDDFLVRHHGNDRVYKVSPLDLSGVLVRAPR